MQRNRRDLLKLGSIAVLGGLAGCSESPPQNTTATDPGTPTETATESAGEVTPQGIPGADVLGGPEALQSAATVDATVLSEDQGAGTFVNTPAVVWLEAGGTVTWNIEGGAHSVTAYHADADRVTRIPEGASPFDSGILEAGETYEHTFETEGVYNYFCRPHEGLGMVGLVIVGGPQGGPGTTAPADVETGAAKERLSRLLEVAGISTDGSETQEYTWQDATWDSYWYSLYNMSTNIAMSANGVLFPHNEEQRKAFNERFPAMLKAANQEKPPVKNPNLNMAAFTEGDPHFTQKPILSGPDGRPDASTLKWDKSKSSGVVSPASAGYTHLKGVTWAKNFQAHFDILPESLAAEFRSEVLTTLAQIGTKSTLIAGGPEGNGALTKGDSMELVSGFKPAAGEVVDPTARPHQHAAMLWFLSDMVSLATGGWFGYENPEPLIPPKKIQMLTDGLAKTTMSRFPPETVVEMGSTRDLGEMLAAVGWYGTHAGNDELRAKTADYANALGTAVDRNLAGNGAVENGAANQAATQGIVGQGLVWASQIDGVDHTGSAREALGYLLDELWDDDAGTFSSGSDDATYTITARDAGDITGGLNAADAELGISGVKDVYAIYFNQTFNRGRLQRAERPQSRTPDAEYTLPLPPKAGGDHGQAAVYNTAVEYDTEADEWSVVDPRFDCEQALYLANQDIWIGQWGGDFYQGRGVPGKSDTPR